MPHCTAGTARGHPDAATGKEGGRGGEGGQCHIVQQELLGGALVLQLVGTSGGGRTRARGNKPGAPPGLGGGQEGGKVWLADR